jgi:AraC family transcriptional regulator, regulatory protein of adaptative response / methylated-DNA-[protein]-cysteine methyltransferase
MTPRQYGKGGAAQSISYASGQTPLGLLMIGATDRGICFIQWGKTEDELRAELAREFPAAALSPMNGAGKSQFDAWMKSLSQYLKDGAPLMDLPLDIRGTAFQVKVWKYLQKIPAGTTCTYTDVAKGVGRPEAARAVARAIATNRIAVAIPCHRVIRSDGGLSGYRWDPARKKKLIDLEQGNKT